MKKYFSPAVLLASSTILLCCSSLNAGTMGPVNTAHNWTGLYLGANAGGIWGPFASPLSIEPVTTTTIISERSVVSFNTTQGSFTGGGQIGYNAQFNNNWVIGAEFNINGEHLKGTDILTEAEVSLTSAFVADDVFTATNSWHSSVLARLGYAMNNWLFYATGGVGFSSVRFESLFIEAFSDLGEPLPAVYGASSQMLIGGTYGLGLEYALNTHLRVGVEGRYTDYGRKEYNLPAVPVALSTTGPGYVYASSYANLHVQTGEVLFKVNYQFA